jgi:hypothetical protein
MSALLAVAVWLQPVLLTVLTLRVVAGNADAPWLVLGALVAPLVALLGPAGRPAHANPVATGAVAIGVALVLAADLVIAADVAALLGGAPWHGMAVAAALVLLAPLLPAARRAAAPALVLAAVGLLLPLGAIALRTGALPWTAWTYGSLRPALTFPEASAWVHEGERFARDARLTFSEGQRVTALTEGLYRVVERDAAAPTVREWRLAAGDALTLRPGDELSVQAGVRMRFDPGRRMPGVPVTGIAWADAPARGPTMLPAALGALVTLVGGAVALVPGTRRVGLTAALGPLVLMASVSAAVGWGVYAAAAAPDLALGGSPPAPLVRLPPRALGPASGASITVLVVVSFVVLLLAAAVALRGRLAATAGRHAALWPAAVAVAAALGLWSPDPWRLLLLALGLAAAAGAPARLAGSRLASIAGSGVGAVVFVALAGLPLVAPGASLWLETLVRYPALAAVPLGWGVVRALDEPGGSPGRRARAPAR